MVISQSQFKAIAQIWAFFYPSLLWEILALITAEAMNTFTHKSILISSL